MLTVGGEKSFGLSLPLDLDKVTSADQQHKHNIKKHCPGEPGAESTSTGVGLRKSWGEMVLRGLNFQPSHKNPGPHLHTNGGSSFG
jgi:hypothetical protein